MLLLIRTVIPGINGQGLTSHRSNPGRGIRDPRHRSVVAKGYVGFPSGPIKRHPTVTVGSKAKHFLLWSRPSTKWSTCPASSSSSRRPCLPFSLPSLTVSAPAEPHPPGDAGGPSPHLLLFSSATADVSRYCVLAKRTTGTCPYRWLRHRPAEQQCTFIIAGEFLQPCHHDVADHPSHTLNRETSWPYPMAATEVRSPVVLSHSARFPRARSFSPYLIH
jgi:hypothetical protein